MKPTSCNGYGDAPRPLYRVDELTRLTGMNRWQVRRLLARNGVRTIHSGRRVYVPLSGLRQALPDLFESLLEARVLRTG